MRLLHVTHQYRPAIGGAEQYIAHISEELVKRGHQVDVFTSRSVDYRTWRNELPHVEQIEGVNVFRFSSLPRGRQAWRALAYGLGNHWRTGARRYEPFVFYGNGPVCPAMFVALWRQGRNYDLVHINNIHYSHAFVAHRAAQLRQVPTIVTPHLHAEQKETYDVGYMRAILQASKTVLAVTRPEKEFMIGQRWNSEVVVGGNGLRLDRFPALDRQQSRTIFGLPSDGMVMLFLGRKTHYKGLEMCLEAFVNLRQKRSDVYFLAVGPETEFSQQLWSRYRGLDGLVVRGAVSDEERLAALAACDVLALPSTGEAFGIVYLEAWAYRKPVIGARIASVSALIGDGQDGFLVEPHQVDLLAHHLDFLAGHPDRARSMGEQGRAKLERYYTVERIVDVVEGAYARTVRRQRTLSGKGLKCASV